MTAHHARIRGSRASRAAYRPGLIKRCDGGRVFGGDQVLADFRMAGGADPGGRIDILQPERNAVQRAAMVARHDSHSAERACSRALLGVISKNALSCGSRASARNQCLDQFDRRQLASLDQPGSIGNRQPMQAVWCCGQVIWHAGCSLLCRFVLPLTIRPACLGLRARPAQGWPAYRCA